ncbi:hemoglobin [Faunimonas pinastri]|uniref:Hemoglobin n=1 Tax=Faunimonas pinastri TaxID=1855383 RepID=A0A1H9IHK4_9HYPH|nr:group III truncated hemoglobin [Faunimonas pinastri]SEQ74038.1 hemoglobin [Faunimonas pinastri]
MSSPNLKVVAGGPDRRAQITAEIAGRTGIDDLMIEKLVRAFYGRARQDPLIGPIFDAHIADWEAHIAKLCDFWSSVALMTGRYHGTPMRVHMPLPLDQAAFSRWLAIFGETAREVCPPAAAEHFVERANRIANSLEMGVATSRGQIVAPRI